MVGDVLIEQVSIHALNIKVTELKFVPTRHFDECSIGRVCKQP